MKWISVKDSLPDDDEFKLVALCDKYGCAYHIAAYEKPYWFSTSSVFNDERVTHWREIPLVRKTENCSVTECKHEVWE